jgi:hypothetical protein
MLATDILSSEDDSSLQPTTTLAELFAELDAEIAAATV